MLELRISLVLLAGLALTACGGGRKARPQASQSAAASPAPAAKEAPMGGQDGATADVRTSDIDQDGRPEVFKYYSKIDDPERPGQQKVVLTRQDLDLNWDGKVDIWRHFDPATGLVVREEWDTDFDGRVDETRHFEGAYIVRSERDRNNDGRADVIRYYKLGVLERKESDTNGDGQVDRWEYFNGRVLDRIGIDRDHDGTVDSWAKSDAKGSGG